MRSTRRILAGLALPFVAAGCGILGGANLPTHRDWGGESPATPETGQLVLSDDCVWLVNAELEETWLVVWPPGTSRSGPDIVGSGGLELAKVGDDVALEGGEYDAVEVVSQLDGADPLGVSDGSLLACRRCDSPEPSVGLAVRPRFEDVPTQLVAQALVVEDELADLGGELGALPFALPAAGRPTFAC